LEELYVVISVYFGENGLKAKIKYFRTLFNMIISLAAYYVFNGKIYIFGIRRIRIN
jgi:hypothetical protein